MSMRQNASGIAELRKIRRQSNGQFLAVGVFSVFVNLLMLTGPIFMLQIYDRVLGSRSVETLTALFVLVAALYLFMGILDYARGRVLARVGAWFQSALDHRVFDAVLRRSLSSKGPASAEDGLRDLESVRSLMTSPVLFAVFDMPWTPIFAAAIFIFHPWLGALAVLGGSLLILAALMNQWMTKRDQTSTVMNVAQADHFAQAVKADAETVRGMGMQDALLQRWKTWREKALELSIAGSDRSGGFQATTKAFRLFLQSAILALGAYLVLQGQLTAGAMIAASILLGRALAPIEQAIGQWQMVQRAQLGWNNLSDLLQAMPPEKPRIELPRPKASLTAENVTALPPGEHQACLRMISFSVEPGTAMGVIGQSAAGKSSLARLITGIWQPVSGKLRLDHATLDQYDPEVLGSYIGYLPQNVSFFQATIAENIARMALQPDAQKVVEAAKKAGAHEMILAQPNGYDTVIGPNGGRLSGGQKQRLALARALYGNPLLLVLDEPNSNLDSIGSEALNQAIRHTKAEGGAVIIMAHRPAAIAECDTLLVLEQGMRKAFGPRDEVLNAQVKNVAQIKAGLGAKS